VEVVNALDVVLRVGCSQDHHGYLPQALVGLDLGQKFPAVFAGEVEVEQDQVGTRSIVETLLAAEKGEGFLAVRRHVQRVGQFAVPHGFPHEPDIPGVVIHQ